MARRYKSNGGSALPLLLLGAGAAGIAWLLLSRKNATATMTTPPAPPLADAFANNARARVDALWSRISYALPSNKAVTIYMNYDADSGEVVDGQPVAVPAMPADATHPALLAASEADLDRLGPAIQLMYGDDKVFAAAMAIPPFGVKDYPGWKLGFTSRPLIGTGAPA